MRRARDIGEDAARAMRHRKFRWCRLWNDFLDMPLWRVIAGDLDVPLSQVQAFVVRLDTLANKSVPRSSVEDFEPAEFAAALDMSPDTAARLYAALEAREWIAQGHLAGFFERNPDKDDPTSAERKERERAFKRASRELARYEREGLIDAGERFRREQALSALRDQGQRHILTWAEQQPRLKNLLHLSTSHACHSVTSVTVTPRAEQSFQKPVLDNSGEIDEAASTSAEDPQSEALTWLQSTGLRIVTQRLDEPPRLAANRIERWLHQRLGGNAVALREIVEGAQASDATVARFMALVDDGIKRWLARAQPELALPPRLLPAAGLRRGGGHG